jgi:hypothetical protein
MTRSEVHLPKSVVLMMLALTNQKEPRMQDPLRGSSELEFCAGVFKHAQVAKQHHLEI